jgi:uncharacterized protein involved in outer membrane biogenesis
MTGAPRKFLRKRHLFWAIPLVLVVIAVLGVLALPRFVSSGYHRATIENLASSLTGRNVHINGKLHLALLPQPQFIAGDVTITGPDKETITASSLTLDIAPIPLLRGEISARSLTLQSPRIALPWPLPGGAAAIAPPRWLTTLHAQVNDGVVSLGAIIFTHVSADIFTGGDGAFSISGTGDLFGNPLHLSLGFGAVSAVGSTPITLDVTAGNAALHAHISGTYDSSSTLSGKAAFSLNALPMLRLSQQIAGTADILADANQVALGNLDIGQGQASLSGSATLAFSQKLLTLLLSGQNLVVPFNPLLFGAADAAFGALPTHLTLDAVNTTITHHGGVIAIPDLHSTMQFGAAGTDITSLDAELPGNSGLSLSGVLDPAGNLQAKAIFNSSGISDFLAAFGANPSLPANWQQTSLAGDVHGNPAALTFDHLTGNFGPAQVTGTAILAERRSLIGALHFDQLDLTPFAAMLRNPPNRLGANDVLTGDFEITADRASIDNVPLQHLLIDARYSNQLVVRRLTASLYGGIAAASFTLSPNPAPSSTGIISSARAILNLPSAQPLAALLPAWAQPPAALTKAPLALSFLAAGPANALATSASLSLGQISMTAAPTLDLIHQTASGAFTLRHPDAIAAFKAFGLNAGLAWPGAGSIALRANMLVSPTQIGFSDFVLSLGDFTGNGRLIYGFNQQLNGEIDADTLALPPIGAGFIPPWAALGRLQGKIGISTNQVLLAGNPILGQTAASLTLGPNRLDVAIAKAGFGNGVLTGDISATTGDPAPAATPPSVTAKFAVTGADASMLNLQMGFPITLGSGSVDAAADLAASGYAPQAWLATLSGSASLTAHSGSLGGFSLPGIARALAASPRRLSRLRAACIAGATPFSSFNVAGNFSSGIYTITAAALQGEAGSAVAQGSIDLPDAGMTLKATLRPNLPSPPSIGLTIAGSWTAPRKTTALKQALGWKAPAAK